MMGFPEEAIPDLGMSEAWVMPFSGKPHTGAGTGRRRAGVEWPHSIIEIVTKAPQPRRDDP